MVLPVASVSYPGTVNPLRGLSPFTESERDVLFGRYAEREELSRLVSGEGFRAGLLYGDAGVGKSSLLRAGMVPHLRDHGVVAVFCDNPHAPIDSLAEALGRAGATPAPNEQNLSFLTRVTGSAGGGQLYLFIVDEAEAILDDDRVVSELGDMFARVVARSGGRARFLFACASSKIHLFGKLERRTGSLFPPSSRYHLSRFEPQVAAAVLDRTLSLAGVQTDPALASAVVAGLGQAVLPADVQIAALAIRELRLSSPADLARVGGPSELERLWLSHAAGATGNERSGLRLLAELAQGEGVVPVSPESAAARASLDPGWSASALQTLAERGIVRAVAIHGQEGFHYVLAHEILSQRIREVAAPARAAARRAFELLGSKAAQNKRLSAREWWSVWREGLTPTTPAERAVLDRTRRVARIVAAAAVGGPLLLLILVYIAMSGSYYLDVGRSKSGLETVVVRAGSPGLSAFHWLPASPSFGSIVADTGYRRTMIEPKAWKKIVDHDVSADDAYAETAADMLEPRLSELIAYASDGSESALDALVKAAATPAQRAELLAALASIARGGPKEVALVEQSLLDPSPSVQSAALSLASETTRRKPDVYRDTLARALTSSDAELRRLTFSAVRALGPKPARDLFSRALASNPEGAARQELVAVVTSNSAEHTVTAAAAVSVLSNQSASAPARERARELLRRAFQADPAGSTKASSALIADAAAPTEDKQLAFELILDLAPKELYGEIAGALGSVMSTPDEALRAAALPLYARVSTEAAAGELALLTSNEGMSERLRTAVALAWGEVARSGAPAAQPALEQLIADTRPAVRAAAASAYGYVGRPAQEALLKLVKTDRFDVVIGAMYGLAHSAEVGANASNAVYGIANQWKKKGRPRREAARVYAAMARTKPAPVLNYLAAAARMADDPGLHVIGVEGLCNAMTGAQKRNAARELARSVDDPAPEVRRKVIECVSDYPEDTGTATRIATAMADDRDAEIRAESARVLSALVAKGEPSQDVAKSLVALARDDVRDVRVLALDALAALGAGAPEDAKEALARAFSIGDEAEKLVVLDAAQAIGAGGLIELAMADESALVRIAGLDTAIATSSQVSPTINSALTDPDPGLRRAALERLSEGKHGLSSEDVDRALALAIRDRDESISDLALTTLARLGEIEQVKLRLATTLASRSERERARAAAALGGLTDRKPKDAVDMLEPLLADPSHDVRAAMLPSLAAAWAKVHPPEELEQRLRKAEKHATRRLTATAAFIIVARTEAGRAAAIAGLEKIAKSGAPMARQAAKLGLGLIASSADGVAFLAHLTP